MSDDEQNKFNYTETNNEDAALANKICASYMGHVARHDNTMTSPMIKSWTPEHDETTCAMRARTKRKHHSTIVAERGLSTMFSAEPMRKM